MNVLDRLKRATTLAEADPSAFSSRVRVRLITNFTDDVLRKMFIGACLEEGIHPDIRAVPYKQYAIALQNDADPLWLDEVDVTYVLFDASPYQQNEFTSDPSHLGIVMDGVERLIAREKGLVVLHPFIQASRTDSRGNPLADAFTTLVRQQAEIVVRLAGAYPTVRVCDPNRIVHRLGETHVRDLRNAHAFDLPFTNEFTHALTDAWVGIIRPLTGRLKKAVVVDLDNTLWGGVVGEAGVNGLALGADYPGSAFMEFQRALLELHRRGILLAVNSRNNRADVDEVFVNHPSMLLTADHFASIQANWDNKADNLVRIAEELNIGVDSLVFFDDDAANRALVRQSLPQVLVPEIDPLMPERYVPTLLSLQVFPDAPPTEEDLARNKMMLEERKRNDVKQTVVNVEDYIASLNLHLTIERSHPSVIPRIAQLTQKTNQFNLTTIRHTEQEITDLMTPGIGEVYSLRVVDRFGDYGLVGGAIIRGGGTEVDLENIFLSCRVLGRSVEMAFMDKVLDTLFTRGVERITARFIPTAKNAPVKGFLPSLGFRPVREDGGIVEYVLTRDAYSQPASPGLHSIHIELL